MGLAIFIIVVQFGVIGWLAYPRLKPNAEKYWKRAEDMVKRLNSTDKERWTEDFNRLQGIETEPPKPVKPVHTVTNKWATTEYGIEQLNYKCSCGYIGHGFTVWGATSDWTTHVEIHKELGT